MLFWRSGPGTSHGFQNSRENWRVYLLAMNQSSVAHSVRLFLGCFLMFSGGANAFCQQDSKGPVDASNYHLLVKKQKSLQQGFSRYIVSLRLPDGDRVSSVFGTDVYPVELKAPEGVYNSPYNAGWSASGMNPNFFKLMPEMEDDSYATIGLTTSAQISGIPGAEDPTMVQDPGLPWDEFFTKSGETQLTINTHTGGAYFVLRTAANGAPVNGEVLLMQVTTSGEFSGDLNIQIFPQSDNYDELRWRTSFDGAGEFSGYFID